MTTSGALRWLRRIAAFGFVGAGAYLMLWEGSGAANERCSTRVLESESEPTQVETTCEPYAIDDVLLLAGLGLLLLLPDLSDLEIAGLVTMRRRIAEQQARQDVLETQVLGLSQTVSQGTYVQLHVGALERSAERVEQLAPLLEPMEIEKPRPPTLDLEVIAEPPTGSLEEQLTTVAERLREVSRVASSPDPPAGVTDRTMQALVRWRELFVREASMVEAVAARLGSATAPSEAEMNSALQLGLRLLDLVNQAVNAAEVKKKVR